MGQLREPWSRFGFLFLSSPCGCAQVFKNSSKALSYLLLSAKKCFFTNNIHYCSVTIALVVFIFGALFFQRFCACRSDFNHLLLILKFMQKYPSHNWQRSWGKIRFCKCEWCVWRSHPNCTKQKWCPHWLLFVGKNLQATVDSLIFCARWINVKSNKVFLLRRNKLMVFLCFKCYSDNTHSSYLGAKRLQ